MIKVDILNAIKAQGGSDAAALRAEAAAGEITDTEIIDRERTIPDFSFKDYTNYAIGTPVADGGQVYGLLQPYNASLYPQRPAELPALWGLKHTKNPAKAKPYVAPMGTSGLYMKDECCIYDGLVYRCLNDNNPYSPVDYPAAWEEVV